MNFYGIRKMKSNAEFQIDEKLDERIANASEKANNDANRTNTYDGI